MKRCRKDHLSKRYVNVYFPKCVRFMIDRGAKPIWWNVSGDENLPAIELSPSSLCWALPTVVIRFFVPEKRSWRFLIPTAIFLAPEWYESRRYPDKAGKKIPLRTVRLAEGSSLRALLKTEIELDKFQIFSGRSKWKFYRKGKNLFIPRIRIWNGWIAVFRPPFLRRRCPREKIRPVATAAASEEFLMPGDSGHRVCSEKWKTFFIRACLVSFPGSSRKCPANYQNGQRDEFSSADVNFPTSSVSTLFLPLAVLFIHVRLTFRIVRGLEWVNYSCKC